MLAKSALGWPTEVAMVRKALVCPGGTKSLILRDSPYKHSLTGLRTPQAEASPIRLVWKVMREGGTSFYTVRKQGLRQMGCHLPLSSIPTPTETLNGAWSITSTRGSKHLSAELQLLIETDLAKLAPTVLNIRVLYEQSACRHYSAALLSQVTTDRHIYDTAASTK